MKKYCNLSHTLLDLIYTFVAVYFLTLPCTIHLYIYNRIYYRNSSTTESQLCIYLSLLITHRLHDGRSGPIWTVCLCARHCARHYTRLCVRHYTRHCARHCTTRHCTRHCTGHCTRHGSRHCNRHYPRHCTRHSLLLSWQLRHPYLVLQEV